MGTVLLTRSGESEGEASEPRESIGREVSQENRPHDSFRLVPWPGAR